MKPNIQAWFNDLKKKCNIVEVIFFGDFSKFREKEIKEEYRKGYIIDGKVIRHSLVVVAN